MMFFEAKIKPSQFIAEGAVSTETGGPNLKTKEDNSIQPVREL